MGQGARPCWILFVSWSTWGQMVRQKHWEDTRRHKTSQDVTRPSQNCNANRHSLLHFNHTNITCPNVCPSVVNPRSPTETVFMCMCRSLQCGTLFQNVWSNPTFLLSVVFVQGHKLPNDKFRKKCHDMIWYPTIDIDLKSECLWTCSCRCHYIIDFFYLLYLNGVLSIFCSPNIFTGCDVSYFRKFRQHIQNTFKHIKDTLKNTTHINTCSIEHIVLHIEALFLFVHFSFSSFSSFSSHSLSMFCCFFGRCVRVLPPRAPWHPEITATLVLSRETPGSSNHNNNNNNRPPYKHPAIYGVLCLFMRPFIIYNIFVILYPRFFFIIIYDPLPSSGPLAGCRA